MRTSSDPKGLTSNEVFVGVFIVIVVVLLFSMAQPSFGPGAMAPQTIALMRAKQIGLACKQYAIDYNGQFPTFITINGTTTSTRISDYSNIAFDQLIPVYLETNTLFHVPKSAWTPTALPDLTKAELTKAEMDPRNSLPAGSNEWAYVAGLRDDPSNGRLPLIADGFADLKTHAYATDPLALGGVCKGESAVVICDDSARYIKCDPTTHKIPGSPNGADLFDTGSQQGWLTSTGTDPQTVLNPIPPTKPPERRKKWLFW